LNATFIAQLMVYNPELHGVLDIDFNRSFGRSALSDQKLRDLIEHFSKVPLRNEDFEFPDLLGAAYEYLISQFAVSFYPWSCTFVRPWFCRGLSVREKETRRIFAFSACQQPR
jgi:hypothetical protein